MRVPLAMRSFPAARRLPAACVLALAGCSDSQGPAVEATCPDHLVTVSVTGPSTATPSFTWTPACAVSVLQVTALDPASGVAWVISGRQQNIIPSNVGYGQVPFGAQESVAPTVLVAGASYEVHVQRAVGSQGGTTLVDGGVTTFTH
jgi:hypothetical protein